MSMRLQEVKTRDVELDSNEVGISFDVRRPRIHSLIRVSAYLYTA